MTAVETGPTETEIISALRKRRLPLSDEKRLQEAVADALTAAGVPFEREVRLTPREVIDFLAGSIGIEIKIKGGRRDIYRQCERYCASDRIGALVLVTQLALRLPATINSKPCTVCDLGKAWL